MPFTEAQESELRLRRPTTIPSADEIVISGIAGRFPESDSVKDLQDNLMSKRDLVTEDDRRWKLDNHPDLPRGCGKISNIEKFDASFFGVHPKQGNSTDPIGRMMLEHAFEAIIDAGINPMQLRGTNTGVFVGATIGDSQNDIDAPSTQVFAGFSRPMLANGISYCLDVNGPSYLLDTGCSSSLYALEQAYRAINDGLCDDAVVASGNICLQPSMTRSFALLGALSSDGRCRTFDESAVGYVRSEAVAVVFLQKAKHAKRIYATLVNCKTNCDGYKEEGITFPSSRMQSVLLENLYQESGVPPSSVSYFEAHGTGTKVGDPVEVNGIDEVMCQGRSADAPLLIGSVKSNLGHTEWTSGLVSVIKVIIAMESGMIPPNIHFNRCKPGLKAIEEGRLKVVEEVTPWAGGYAGINAFGVGGSNAHALLKSNNKEKLNGGAPADDLPRLVAVSGRTEEAVAHILDHLKGRAVDTEFVGLLHEIHSSEIDGHLFRGYTVLPPRGVTEAPPKAIEKATASKRPVWFFFSGMGSQWPGMGEALLQLPAFARAISKCDAVLKPLGVDVHHVITNKDKAAFDVILNAFVGTTAVQIGLVDVLHSLGIEPDHIIGHSFGELACAYADGCMSAEQTILASYYRGLVSIQTEVIRGSMAVVGLGYQQLREICPADIVVACHNSANSATLSGPADSMRNFIKEIEAKGIFVREVVVSNIAYHSRYIEPFRLKFLAYLRQVIADPKPRTSKWVSTSIPMEQWDTELARYSSAEYHTNNLLSQVLFEEASALIPKDAIVIEIAPHGLFQSILRKSLQPGVTNIPLALRGHQDNMQVLLQAIGKMFNSGLHPHLSKLYPAVNFPVSRSTPMISPLLKWEHSEDWYVPRDKSTTARCSGERIVKISVSDSKYESLAGHIFDGRNLLPATAYLTLIWETLAMMQGKVYTNLSVVFKDVRLLRATTIPKEGTIELTLMINRGTGRFEVIDGDVAVATGFIHSTLQPTDEITNLEPSSNYEEESMNSRDVYKDLKLRGYQYTGKFRGIVRASTSGRRGHIAWLTDWIAFMDSMLQMRLLGLDSRNLCVPTAINKIVINTNAHLARLNSEHLETELEVFYEKSRDVIICAGVQIFGLSTVTIPKRKDIREPIIEQYKFIPCTDEADVDLREIAILSTNIAVENETGIKMKTVELFDEVDAMSFDELLSPWISHALQSLPLIQADVTVITSKNDLNNDTFPTNISVVNHNEISRCSDALLVVGYRLLSDQQIDNWKLLLNTLKPGGFVLTRENQVENIGDIARSKDVHIVLLKKYKGEWFVLLRKREKLLHEPVVIHVRNEQFDWLDTMRKKMLEAREKKVSDNPRIWFVAQEGFENGLLGFMTCLRRELGGEFVRGILIQDTEAPPFCLENPLYAEQVQKDLAINVLRENRVWGTYRHLPLPPVRSKSVQHKYIKQLVQGNLSSLTWTEGPLNPRLDQNNLVQIAYAALNFRDIMLASGKLEVSVAETRLTEDNAIGIEYSGVDNSGNRVMGLIIKNNLNALSNLCIPDRACIYNVPHSWSLEDAATVPCVYATCIYALYMKGNVKKGDKILIHAGSGGVGQAAINLALAEGCEVFTTVGTPEKRQFIRDHFPQIGDDHIGDSRSTSFVDMIARITNNRGVDIVLNSLSEEKLLASVDCLAPGGRFLEIGKFDLAANNPLGMGCFERGISFHGIMLNLIILNGPLETKLELQKLVNAYLDKGVIKPLTRTVFATEQVEEAFRYMTNGRHIGKVLVKVGNEENPTECAHLAVPQYHCLRDRSYIIIGGLGGFGLELADWMVLRGAKNLILTSRKGVTTGYQKMRIELWKSYGVNVTIVVGNDASSYQDCQVILETAAKFAPVDGIFNLALVLKDAFWENQTAHSFEETFKPKARATKNLDMVSRILCPELRHFVVFSSLACGKGNAGQCNYGMANSVMERICEKRVAEGLPGLAIQWGAIGDVGVLSDMQVDNKELVIAGTALQSISSCLQVLDGLLSQNQTVVSSMVLPKEDVRKTSSLNLVETVQHMMGLKDLKTVSATRTLAELGLDSMLCVEIIQTLQREFSIFLTVSEIRALTFSKLQEMNGENNENEGPKVNDTAVEAENLVQLKAFARLFGGCADLSNLECTNLRTQEDANGSEIFFIPGIEGVASIFDELAPKIEAPATCLQLGICRSAHDSIPSIADSFLPDVLERCGSRGTFKIVGYSFGSLVAIELARKLEAQGLHGELVLIDGAPDFAKAMVMQGKPLPDADSLQNRSLSLILNVVAPLDDEKLSARLKKCSTWTEKVDALNEICPHTKFNLSLEKFKICCSVIYKRHTAIVNYDISGLPKIKAPITLIKPTIRSVPMDADDYNLGKVSEGLITIRKVEGNHSTMLNNDETAFYINISTSAPLAG